MKKSTIIIGLQYGDEGKGKIVDLLAKNADIIARFNGGANAGHTIIRQNKKIVLRQIPAGAFYSNKILYINSNCVVNPIQLKNEINELKQFNITLKNRLKISSKTTLVQPHHMRLDEIFGSLIGTTKNGIGPAYSEQALRLIDSNIANLRIGDYVRNPNKGSKTIKENLKRVIREHKLVDNNVSETARKFNEAVMTLAEFVEFNPLFLEELVSNNKQVIFEGSQSIMLDCVTGTVPFVTSSRTLPASAYLGDISIKHHGKVVGVALALPTRIGNGPFMSEFGGSKSERYCGAGGGYTNTKTIETKKYSVNKLIKSHNLFDLGIAIRMTYNEYGIVTGRPARIGMLDLVMLRQNCKLNGIDEIYLNKFDELLIFNKTTLKGIPIVTAYSLNNKKIKYMPTTQHELRKTSPIINYFPFIPQEMLKVKTYDKLPLEAKNIIKLIEVSSGVPIKGIGMGPKKEQIILKKGQ
ncbi:MAG: adenylosuccinate synthetase [Candidatus Micrarchaeota archaeon]